MLGTATLSLQPGCEDRRTVAYEIAKEFSPAASIPLSSGGGTHEVEPGGGPERAEPLTWTAPAHWKTKTASATRRASYAVPMNEGSDADLSISVLGGAAGGLPANINRWRAQLALPELSPGEVTGTTESIPAGGLMFTLIDIAGKSDDASVRMLVGAASFEGQTWFFKLTGPDEGVAAEKPAFVAFLRTVKSS